MSSWQQREWARAILSREIGGIRKPHGDRLRIALAFPNTYFVGMSNLGFQTVYRLFNERDDAVCERVFLPPKQAAAGGASRRPRASPRWSRRLPVADFDVLAFSVSFEWDYTNVLTMLRLGRPAPARRRTRPPAPARRPRRRDELPEPRAAGAVRRRRVRRRRAKCSCRPSSPALRPAAAARAVLERLARQPGMYVPSLVDVRYDADGTHRRLRAGSRRRACACPSRRRRSARRSWPTRRPRPCSRPTPSSARGCSSRSSAAAPTCAASAGPGTTTCPSAPSTPTGSCASPRPRARTPRASGLVSIALCDHPEIERILGRLARAGLPHQPGLASRSTTSPRRSSACSARAASAASPSRRRRARTGCAA